ncbi:UNVERIFIED_CONTAM: hypothetical protein FKN15_053848 [Acipenser sinensis]
MLSFLSGALVVWGSLSGTLVMLDSLSGALTARGTLSLVAQKAAVVERSSLVAAVARGSLSQALGTLPMLGSLSEALALARSILPTAAWDSLAAAAVSPAVTPRTTG